MMTSVRDKQNTRANLVLARANLQVDIADKWKTSLQSTLLYMLYNYNNDVRNFVYNQTRNFIFRYYAFVRNATFIHFNSLHWNNESYNDIG